MSFIHCIYASTSTAAVSDADLQSILSISRANNAAAGVSGMLLHSLGSFFQVLEGRTDAVEATYERIVRDPRHVAVTKIIFERIAHRSFADWTMGFAATSEKDLAEIAGRNDFFDTASCLTNMRDGRARRLLAAFSKGRWRVRLGDNQELASQA